jgi:hypothetical protein
MASGKRPPSDAQRRRRPPPVINLEATEVESGLAADAPGVDPPVQPPQPESAPPKPDDAFIPPPPVKPVHAASEPPSEPPPPEPPREPPSPPPGPPPKGRRFAWLPEELSWPQASAGIAGAAGGLLLFVLLWLVGAFSGGREPSADLGPRLASIEKQLKDLAARPAPASVDPKTIEDVAARVGRLESAQAVPRAPVTDPVVLGRLSATENSAKSLADNVAALSRRVDAVDYTLHDMQARLNKMSANLNELQTNARAAAAGSDRSARLAVAAAALRDAVERGDPFAAELAVVKPLAFDAGLLAPLEPFAASGVPSNAVLGQELAAIIRPMLRAAGEPPRDGSILDRLQANAEKLIRIRPVDEARGDDRSAILARIEQRAGRADIPGALAELAKLPPAARAPAQAWIAKAEARNKAIEASRQLAADAIAALKATP